MYETDLLGPFSERALIGLKRRTLRRGDGPCGWPPETRNILVERPLALVAQNIVELMMNDLTHLSPQFDQKKGRCRAIIETPKGSRNKFDYDPESNLFTLGGLLPEGMMFPFDFGFIPSTVGGDGDPLDIMVLLDAPAHVGCLIDVRLIGVVHAEQTENGTTEENDRLFGVAIHSYEHENLNSITDAQPSLLKQVEAFFVSYNKQRGKKFKIIEVGGPKKALKMLAKSMDDFKKQQKKQKKK